MNELAERTETKAPQESGGSELTRLLCVFLNEQWKDELGMKATINTAHPEAEMDCYRMHETHMLRYEQLFRIVCQSDKLARERDRLLVLATKFCPREHHDWGEILKIAGDV